MQVRNGRQVEGLCHTYACIRSPATNTPSDLFRMTVRRVFQRRLWSLEFSQINIRCWPTAGIAQTIVYATIWARWTQTGFAALRKGVAIAKAMAIPFCNTA